MMFKIPPPRCFFFQGLSLFNVVKFQNDLCAGSKKNGTCYTKAECESKGGTESGDCAQGFGVCCVISLDCGAMSNDNNTYLERTTTTDLVGSSCSYEICPANSKICRIRYDFTVMTTDTSYSIRNIQGTSRLVNIKWLGHMVWSPPGTILQRMFKIS